MTWQKHKGVKVRGEGRGNPRKKNGSGVLPVLQNLYAIYDQNLQFYFQTPYYVWPEN